MRKLIAGMALIVLLCGATPAQAAWWNPMDWGRSAVTGTVNAVEDTGRTGIGLFAEILVGTDEIFHWIWNIGHDMFLHPIVKTLTFGKVDLDVATELAQPVSE